MKLPWAKKAGLELSRRVVLACDNLLWPRDYAPWLLACIAFESGETFSASTKNRAGSGATGLIQFMPATARDMGTAVDDLATMSACAQMVYVERYFRPYAARIRSLADMYMAILLPSAIGKPGCATLFGGGTAYRENSGLDTDSDGKVTKDEACGMVRDRLARGYLPEFVGDV